MKNMEEEIVEAEENMKKLREEYKQLEEDATKVLQGYQTAQVRQWATFRPFYQRQPIQSASDRFS